MKTDIVIKNCTVVNEEKITERDVLIRDGRIEEVASEISSEGKTIEASGLHLWEMVEYEIVFDHLRLQALHPS